VSARSTTGALAAAGRDAEDSHAPYAEIRDRVPEIVSRVIPRDSTVMVVSKGDDKLVKFNGRDGWHFLRHDSGKYAGYHPADSEAAIEQLEDLRQRGAEYFVVPATAYWWFDYYGEFADHLTDRYQEIKSDDTICRLFYLGTGRFAAPAEDPSSIASERQRLVSEQVSELMRALLPADATVAVVTPENGRPLDLDGLTVLRFPRSDSKERSDSPASPASLMSELSALHKRGAEFLLVPTDDDEWLGDHPHFLQDVGRRYRLLTRQEHLCWTFDLNASPEQPSGHALGRFFRGPGRRTPR
jgi:hypothetical protein